jgi:DNA replication protein DnaC
MELETLLSKLKMDHLEAQIDALCEQAAQRELDYKTFLAEALQTEWQGRFQRGIETRLRQSRFPWIKTLEQFDYDFQPSLDKRQVRELSGVSFIERAHNVVVLSPPGVRKTYLAVALGVKTVKAGYSVLFHPLESLMTRLNRAQHENRLEAALKQLTYPKLLILDELGYLPHTHHEASLFFRLIVLPFHNLYYTTFRLCPEIHPHDKSIAKATYW